MKVRRLPSENIEVTFGGRVVEMSSDPHTLSLIEKHIQDRNFITLPFEKQWLKAESMTFDEVRHAMDEIPPSIGTPVQNVAKPLPLPSTDWN